MKKQIIPLVKENKNDRYIHHFNAKTILKW